MRGGMEPMKNQVMNHAMAAATVLALAVGMACGTFAATQYQVTQRGQVFRPGQITVRRGDIIQIFNDDGELLHHAYVDTNRFSFDSGDQEPGSKTDITFPISGDFSVLCGIHPKMKLLVHVN